MLKRNKLTAFFTLLFSLCLSTLLAQEGNFISPFSRYGIGELQNQSMISRRGMGSASIALSDTNSFNIMNPASCTLLRSFDLEAGAEFKQGEFNYNDTLHRDYNARVPYIAFGMPLRRDTSLRIGLFGALSPFSRIDYRIKGILPKDSQFLTGNGAVNRFQLGLGANFLRFLHLGLSASYIFGHEQFKSALYFTDSSNSFPLFHETNRSIHGFAFDAGMIAGFKTGGLTRLNIGVIANLPTNISFSDDKIAYTYLPLNGYNLTQDTVSLSDHGKMYLPLGLGGGIEFKIFEKTRHLTRWVFSADGYYRQWSKYAEYGISQGLKDYTSVSGGIQWTPYFFKQLDMGSGRFFYYLNYIQYRVGFQYAMLPYTTATGTQYNETKVTLGFGFPLPDRPINTIRAETVIAPILVNAMSYLNLGIEAGQISAADNTALKQKYIALSVGIHLFEPGWFYRRRIE